MTGYSQANHFVKGIRRHHHHPPNNHIKTTFVDYNNHHHTMYNSSDDDQDDDDNGFCCDENEYDAIVDCDCGDHGRLISESVPIFSDNNAFGTNNVQVNNSINSANSNISSMTKKGVAKFLSSIHSNFNNAKNKGESVFKKSDKTNVIKMLTNKPPIYEKLTKSNSVVVLMGEREMPITRESKFRKLIGNNREAIKKMEVMNSGGSGGNARDAGFNKGVPTSGPIPVRNHPASILKSTKMWQSHGGIGYGNYRIDGVRQVDMR